MQIKSKTMMSWSLRKKKEGIFCLKDIFFNICVLFQCTVYWIHFQDIHAFTYQKTLLDALLLLVFKKTFSVSLNKYFNNSKDNWNLALKGVMVYISSKTFLLTLLPRKRLKKSSKENLKLVRNNLPSKFANLESLKK